MSEKTIQENQGRHNSPRFRDTKCVWQNDPSSYPLQQPRALLGRGFTVLLILLILRPFICITLLYC